jgi:hypothetical protein
VGRIVPLTATMPDRYLPVLSVGVGSHVAPNVALGWSGPVWSRTPTALRSAATRDGIGRPGTARPIQAWNCSMPCTLCAVLLTQASGIECGKAVGG